MQLQPSPNSNTVGGMAVATVMMLMARAVNLWQRITVYGAIVVTAALTFVLLIGASAAERRLGKTGMGVLHRVMGLLLAAIAVQFVVDGVRVVWSTSP
jgi:multiple antibiotic resistance protein